MHDPKVLEKRRVKRELIWKANKKHNLFMECWLTPGTETFGNAYKSGLKAGFSKTYSLNIVNQAPKWISEYLEKLELTNEHIKQGLQDLAMNTHSVTDSRSPADTRLKAYETLAKISGMIDSKNSVNVNFVQPILNSESVKQERVKVDSKTSTNSELDKGIETSDNNVDTPTKDTHIDKLIDAEIID